MENWPKICLGMGVLCPHVMLLQAGSPQELDGGHTRAGARRVP